MKFLILVVLIAAGMGANAQQPTDEVAVLQNRVAAQQARLRVQRQELDLLKSEFAETNRVARAFLTERAPAIMAAIAPQAPVAQASAPQPSEPKPTNTPRPPPGIHVPIFTGQEIATSESSDEKSVKVGPADIRILGYVGLSAIFRSVQMGGGPGSSFLSVPFGNTPPGNITEFRATTQTSRLALRVDVPFPKDRLAGYIEADFSGATPGNVVISSSSYGFRVRHAWVDYRHGKFEAAGGQMFSLLTPSKFDIQTWPSDALTTQAVDTNYVAGLVWDRSPSLRVVYRPDQAWSLAASVENPEQQVGNAVKFPAALAPVLNTQYNTGKGELKTPNVGPDTIFKVAWNGKRGARNFHVDAGTLLRFFRNYNPANVTQHKTATGFGANLNSIIDITPKLRLILQGYLSSGGGRYIGGLLPDVIVRSNGDISPVKADSWVSGLELAASRRLSVFTYHSGLYGFRNTAIDLDGSQIGFGYAGSNVGRRLTNEFTGGWAQTPMERRRRRIHSICSPILVSA